MWITFQLQIIVTTVRVKRKKKKKESQTQEKLSLTWASAQPPSSPGEAWPWARLSTASPLPESAGEETRAPRRPTAPGTVDRTYSPGSPRQGGQRREERVRLCREPRVISGKAKLKLCAPGRRGRTHPCPGPAQRRRESRRHPHAESHGFEPLPAVPAARAGVASRHPPYMEAGKVLPEPGVGRRGVHRAGPGPQRPQLGHLPGAVRAKGEWAAGPGWGATTVPGKRGGVGGSMQTQFKLT